MQNDRGRARTAGNVVSAAVEGGGTCLLGRLLFAGPEDDGVGVAGPGPLHLPLVQGIALLPEDLAA